MLRTAPDPVPVPLTIRYASENKGVKFAVTAVSAVKVTVQDEVPVQPPPLQPVKVAPKAFSASRVTVVPA